MTNYVSPNVHAAYKRLTSGASGHTTLGSLAVLCSLLCTLLLSSCASAPKQEDINKAEAHNKLGYSYLNNDQPNEAFVEFQKAIALNPENKEALFNLGFISSIFREYDDAISYYKRSIAVDPHYADAINNLGVLYGDKGDWEEAIKLFQEAVKNPLYLTPDRGYSNLGYAYYKTQDYAKAEQSLNEAILRNPISPLAMTILGLVYIETGDDSAAIKEFKKAIGVQPDYIAAHWELGKTYFRTGEKAKALKHFEIVAEKDVSRERRTEAMDYIEQLKY